MKNEEIKLKVSKAPGCKYNTYYCGNFPAMIGKAGSLAPKRKELEVMITSDKIGSTFSIVVDRTQVVLDLDLIESFKEFVASDGKKAVFKKGGEDAVQPVQ